MIRYHFKDRYKTATSVLTALRSLGSGGTIPPTEVGNQTYQATEVANHKERSTREPSLPPEPQPPTPLPPPKPPNKIPMLIGAMMLITLVFGGGSWLHIQAKNAQEQDTDRLGKDKLTEAQAGQEAEEAVRQYYKNLESGNYQTSWNMMTDSLQPKVSSNYNSYVYWWRDTVYAINVKGVKTLESTTDSAVVGITVQSLIRSSDGQPRPDTYQPTPDTHEISLIKSSDGLWYLNDVKTRIGGGFR